VKTAVALALAVCTAGSARASPAFVTIPTSDLVAAYDTLWAVSDVHGHLDELTQLLRAAGLVTRDGEPRWMSQRQLFLVVGDSIDDGPDSAGVLLLLQSLQAQAAAAHSRVVVLLGNHEADFLANPRGRGAKRLAGSAELLRSMPAAAFVGSWLFAHAGYVEGDAHAYFSLLEASWNTEEKVRLLRDPRSIVAFHRWWERRRTRSALRENLASIGIDGIVFGHDPDAFGATGAIAVHEEGWLTKLDGGLKTRASRGMLLRCDVQRIVRGARLAMTDQGRPTCAALHPDGTVTGLPVR
jgi:Calcineurin-like phosphoesterase